ncbi:MAG: transposase family protein [Mojavia pulchra JT2-VF2]|uniref:Transposase family protein n=1 Tax=Mojavia pulchra JT2-VF2 TaxID=287848 RepID=A0A951Q5Q0_9NOST|nr:transposase family protein [Mojavia pulchra JT2-VF2]
MELPRWVAIELYGCTKYEWLKTFLELPNGIPSHDTAVASTGGNPRTALPHLCASLCTVKPPTVPRMFSVMDEINTEGDISGDSSN